MPIVQFETGQKVKFDSTPSQQDIDEVAEKLGIKKVISTPVQQPQQEGFLKSTAKSILKPFGEVGTSAYNLAKSIGYLTIGKTEKAGEELKKERELPFLGKTKPAITGEEGAIKLGRKVAGYGLEIGSYAPIGFGLSGIAKAGFKGAVGQGLKRGAIEGAIGGGMMGAGEPLREQKSAFDVATGGALGAIGGGILGGTIGIAAPLVGKGLRAGYEAVTKPVEKQIIKIKEIISPILTKKKIEKEIVKGMGKVEEGKVVLETSQKLDEAAKKLYDLDVIKPKQTFVENTNNVLNKISEINAGLETYLKDNPRKLGVGMSNMFDANVQALQIPATIRHETALNNAYNESRDFAYNLIKRAKNTLDILKARQSFDDYVEKEYGKAIWNPESKWSPMKDAVFAIRREMNNFLAGFYKKEGEEKLVEDALGLEHQLFNVIDNLKPKAAKEIQEAIKTKEIGEIKAYLKKHPGLKKVLFRSLEAVGVGGLAKLGWEIFD